MMRTAYVQFLLKNNYLTFEMATLETKVDILASMLRPALANSFGRGETTSKPGFVPLMTVGKIWYAL